MSAPSTGQDSQNRHFPCIDCCTVQGKVCPVYDNQQQAFPEGIPLALALAFRARKIAGAILPEVTSQCS